MMRSVPAWELAPYSVPCGPGQRLDARDVVQVHVERALDRRDRLLVQVDADARQRAGVVAVAAARHAAHVDLREAGPNVWYETLGSNLHVVVEAAGSFSSSSCWVPKAWMLIGTFCRSSVRFCAVTMISSRPPRLCVCA